MEPSKNVALYSVPLPDGNIIKMYEAHDKGQIFHLDHTKNLLATGSRGSGKSLMMRMDAHMRLLSVPGSQAILIRDTYQNLLKSHVNFQGLPWSTLKQEMKLLGGDYMSTDHICHYPNGSKLFLSYVGHEKDAMNLLSAEFIAAYFDELSTIPWDYFVMMSASVRTTMKMKEAGIRGVVRAATNPLGQSASKVNSYFVEKDVDVDDDSGYMPGEWNHVRIDMEDNPHLDREEYIKSLGGSGLAEHYKMAWLHGEYVAEGTLFTFYPKKEGKPYHVIPQIDVEELVKKARIYRVYDHGYKDPAYCAWIAHLGNRYIAFHEKVWTGQVVSQIAASIHEEDRMLGIDRVLATFCDPTLDIHTGHEFRTMKDVFEEHGISMECSINNREQFAAHVHTALAEEAEPGIPRLQILAGNKYSGRGCPYLIKAIPLQKVNPKRPQAMADQAHDHPIVALAYFLISHASIEQRHAKEKALKPWMRPKTESRWTLGAENVRKR